MGKPIFIETLAIIELHIKIEPISNGCLGLVHCFTSMK